MEMRISSHVPPSSGMGPKDSPGDDALIKEYHDLIKAWWAHPNQQNTERLLMFMNQYKEEISAIGKNKKCPFSPPMSQDFNHYLEAVFHNLDRFKEDGYPKRETRAVNEYLTDLDTWIGQKG
jgi:hypothetical protein